VTTIDAHTDRVATRKDASDMMSRTRELDANRSPGPSNHWPLVFTPSEITFQNGKSLPLAPSGVQVRGKEGDHVS